MRECNRESAVRQAVQTGRWTDELRAHLAQCPFCADEALVSGALQSMSIRPSRDGLPDASRAWWAAQLAARQAATARALRPIWFVEQAAGVAAVVAAAAFVSIAQVRGLGALVATMAPALMTVTLVGAAAFVLLSVALVCFSLADADSRHR